MLDMSLIRNLLNIKGPQEYKITEATVWAPEDLREPFRVALHTIEGKRVFLEPFRIVLDNVRVTTSLDRMIVGIRAESGECCFIKLGLDFPGKATAFFDRGQLIIK
jgi:hypothetical protein